MAWKEKNAIKRIYNTFKRLKTGIYTEDAEALKTLNEWLENGSANFVDDNRLFAKILCINLTQNVNYYGDINVAKNNLLKAIQLPLSHHIELLADSLNMLDRDNFLKADITEEEKIKKIMNPWTHEIVSQSFYKTANDILKDIENHT